MPVGTMGDLVHTTNPTTSPHPTFSKCSLGSEIHGSHRELLLEVCMVQRVDGRSHANLSLSSPLAGRVVDNSRITPLDQPSCSY